MSDHQVLKQQVYDATMALNQAGLIRLSAGNISARGADGLIAITPAGLPYDRISPDDIVLVNQFGDLAEGSRRPSSEIPMHTAVYRAMPEVNAMVHTHSIYAISFAVAGLPLDVVCVESLAARGPVPVARYALPGSEQAGEVLLEALQAQPGLRAVLLRNHGLVTVASDMETAWQTAYKVEISAQIIYQARQLGQISTLSDEQIAEIFQIYRSIHR